jgi:RTX calcium-binding nonapeptide repeat (4 copies)
MTTGIMKHLIPALLLALSIPSYAQYYPIAPVTPDEPVVQAPVPDGMEGFNDVVPDNTPPNNPATGNGVTETPASPPGNQAGDSPPPDEVLAQPELPTSPTATARCDGQLATIFGTAASESLRGTMAPDVIVALRGNDKVNGAQGNDVICGGPGNDILNGGPGRDRIAGELGSDNLFAGVGNTPKNQQELHGHIFDAARPIVGNRDYCAIEPVRAFRTVCQNPADYWFATESRLPPRWLVLRANRFNDCGPWPGGC